MICKIKRVIYKILPFKISSAIGRWLNNRRINAFHKNYDAVLERIKGQPTVKVAFFLINSSIWKYDELFKLMQADERFDPVVVICPYIVMGEKVMHRDLEESKMFVEAKGYPYVVTLNFETGEWLDVNKHVAPDLVFYTNPYDKLTRDEYYILNFKNSLNLYIPYSSMICSTLLQFNKELQNYVWKMFIENKMTLKLAQANMPGRGKNCVVVGLASMDALIDDKRQVTSSVWRHQQRVKIIWAPHHTIWADRPEYFNKFSTFLDYADKMIEFSQKYSDDIQISFKPHPLLRGRLETIWGEEKTTEYFNFWKNGVNTQFDNGEYVELFAQSDGMIFDSISFVNEYLYTQKPSLFINSDSIKEQLNELGLEALKCHSIANGAAEIEQFIKQLIANKPDEMRAVKERYYIENLTPPNGMTASQNIIHYLKQKLF